MNLSFLELLSVFWSGLVPVFGGYVMGRFSNRDRIVKKTEPMKRPALKLKPVDEDAMNPFPEVPQSRDKRG